MTCPIHNNNEKFKTFMDTYLKKSDEKMEVGNYKILFGKYKGVKTFREIYDEDKPYVSFLLNTLDYEMNRFFLDYYCELIEVEGGEKQVVEKKATRTRKKKEVEEKKVAKDDEEKELS